MTPRRHAIIATACFVLAPLVSFAQTYPSRPIHIIVAFAPGGPVDVVARLAADKLPELLGGPVVVENRPSSTGNLGAQVVASPHPTATRFSRPRARSPSTSRFRPTRVTTPNAISLRSCKQPHSPT